MLPGYFRLFQGVDGSFVDMHETHGKLESRQNIPIALFLAARGERVRLLPVAAATGAKNPDATRDDSIWEFKKPSAISRNAIDKALRDGSRQADRILLWLPPEFPLPWLEDGIYDRSQRTPNIAAVAVLLGQTLYTFSRSEIVSNRFRGILQ
ncbi:CdiA C-terminal domain-containing protein [Hymenobacter rubidus]|uniref:CdiA C-terminal domain-containing protein n=1 Tax=Hymenobacter rubidus TaxID=1441626 RepID=UPI00191FB0C2|nr:hypothetical protein [Hymenobacter rubidus]